ncbi:MAG TPA: carboxypeptidase-like regulatory domain-containing protein [Bryobacteraceae bacterium]|nr:carboxypeptidase-like regulatory domain-containing protein [Bryobacteraceae bacterium]
MFPFPVRGERKLTEVRRFGSAALLLGGASLWAQMNTGELAGSVQDLLGGLLPGASVVAEQAETGRKSTAVSNGAGEYLLAQLPVGLYSVTASAPNFKASTLRIEVHAGDRLRQTFTLAVADATQVLTVQAEAGNVRLEAAGTRDVIGRQQVANLPLKGRQFLDLAMLSEGVVRPPGGTRGDALQQAGNLVNVLGQRSGHNLYLLDGVSVTDQYFNNLVVAPSIDGTQEFSIQKTSYAAEFGGKSGAVINVISRSGSNSLHGSLFEFVRNDVFDAKNFFDSAQAPIPPFRQNQFGGTLGGPVLKNRTFFFLSYEGQRTRKSLTQTFSVPTAAMRRGDFSGLATIYDPTGAARQPFTDNQISRPLDPIAVALLARVPDPNLPGIAQNLLATENQRVDQNQYSGRFDHQFSQKDTAYLRASLFDARQLDPFGSGVLQESLLPGFGRFLSTHAINGVAAWTHILRANFLNEARFGFLTVAGGQTSPNAGADFAAQTGLEGLGQDPRDLGYPQVSFGGQFTTIGDPALFTFRRNRDFEFYDNVVWHTGPHTIKFGGYAMHYNLQTVNPNGARGIFSFTPRWTSSSPGLADGNAFADFLLGYPTAAQAGLGRAAMDAATNWLQFYAQDSWQVARYLQLDVGIRYEYNQNLTDSRNQMAAIDPSVPGGRFVIASNNAGDIAPAAAALLPLLPIPYITSAAAGWNNSLLVTRPVRFAPRAGLAWNLPGNTVFRAGFGIYPNQASYSIVTNFAQNLPFFVTKTVNSAVTVSPSFKTADALTAGAPGTTGGSNLDHDFQIEYNEVWNAGLERELGGSTTLTLAYIGSRTVHADSGTLLNVPLPGAGVISARRPVPQLSQISDIRWNGWASYQAVTLDAKRRFTRGLLFDANWTWSHSIDDASDPGATFNEANVPQNVYNLVQEKASSSFDHRQRAVASFIYQIPISQNSKAWVRALFGEWQASGNFTAQSGAPFTVNIASDQANIGSGPAQRPNVLGSPNSGPHTPQQWFNPSVFALPPIYTFGDAPRNAVIGPGLEEFDLALQKEGRLKEAARLQFRAEAYNLLNHPNFNIPNRIALTPNFGSISSAQDSRQLQLALKLAF